MSSIYWENGRLMQRVGDTEEELGHMEIDLNSKTHVLWLKDTCNVFSETTSYIQGDEFSSLDEAKLKAIESKSVGHFHLMWLYSLKKKHPDNSEIKERYEEIGTQIIGDQQSGAWEHP